MFRANGLYYTDGYKLGHKSMMAPNTKFLYGTWIPRSLKHAPKSIKKIVSFGHQYTAKRIHDIWKEDFFDRPVEDAIKFAKDMSLYLNLEYDGEHFINLHKLGYLPYRIKALKEGTRTKPNIPHMTLCNTATNDGHDYAWLTLYLETQISFTAWKLATSATMAFNFKKNALKWVRKTDPEREYLVDWMCHDFSARGLSEIDAITSGLGHITSHMGTDTLLTIPASRYYYGVGEDEMPVGSVNASEHSVSTTKIFTVGEKQMLSDWFKIFPKGILSIVSDTFDLWKLITEYISELKEEILVRDGKIVLRPDSGNPVKILCGEYYPINGNLSIEKLSKILEEKGYNEFYDVLNDTYHKLIEENNSLKIELVKKDNIKAKDKGVIRLLWDIFGGDINDSGYKRLDSHIGAIYGDSINLERQEEIYSQLEQLGFASTNVVVGVGSYTYQLNSRDTLGFAAKGSYFEVVMEGISEGYDIYKDPITDDGTKKSLKGLMKVYKPNGAHGYGDITVKEQCTWEEESEGLLQTVYENGNFFNNITLKEIRDILKEELEFDLKYNL